MSAGMQTDGKGKLNLNSTTDYFVLTTVYFFIVHCLLSIAHCPLLIVYCSLKVVFPPCWRASLTRALPLNWQPYL